MSVAAVASPLPPPNHSFDISNHRTLAHMATESPTVRRSNNNKAPRHRQPPTSSQHGEIQSDSNIPTSSETPKSKHNRQRQSDNRATSGNEAPNLRTVPKSQRAKQMPSAQDSPAILATPAKNLAYASAAFHRSPAASSLPMPKFLSKSVPAPGPENSLQARLENEPERTSASPSPPTATVATPDPLAREKSPLDVFFNADRQEKAQKQTATDLTSGNNSPFLANRSPAEANKGLFNLEMDNSESPSANRSWRPPHAQRVASAPGNVPQVGPENDAAAAATKSLREFLKLSPLPAQQQSPNKQPMSVASGAQPYDQQNPFVTTPQHRSRGDSQGTPLHYGNRNLSPLFQAVRTPNGTIVPASNTNNSPLQGKANHPSQIGTPIKHPQPFDPKAFLDHQVQTTARDRSSVPGQPRHMSDGANHNNSRWSGTMYDAAPISPSTRRPPDNGVPVQHPPGQRRPPEGSSNDADVNDMSAKLRGMLNLGF